MKNQLHKSISEIWKDEYVVPLYQRNFAWMEEQIRQLLQDIYDHHTDSGNYYLGSLVVLQRNDGRFEVIDGQQRLTALQIICKDLDISSRACLHYDSRPEVETFFNTLYSFSSIKDCQKFYQSKDNAKISRLVDALRIVPETKIRNFEGTEISFGELPQQIRTDISNFLKNKVILIRVPLPSDTDVAAYFEIMNNRGKQLQPHEVIKALIMNDTQLSANQRSIFATVWDACSQMEIPVQRALALFRKDDTTGRLFGLNYESLNIELLNKYQTVVKEESLKSIDEILSSNSVERNAPQTESNESRYSAIIDFPNFLTHVFKLYDKNVELNGDRLSNAYDKVAGKITPMEFIGKLLTMRVLFDRYVVKVRAENEEDENLQWVLHRPYMSSDGNLKFKNTFSDNTEADDNETEGNLQKRIVKQLSMLQVSFRNRKYKNWLFDYLEWLYSNYGTRIECVSPECIIAHLDNWIENYYTTNVETSFRGENNESVLFKLGVDTPHFLFNFIDYLYWLEKLEGNSLIRFVNEVVDFKFRYYNSVEHHRAQSYSKEEIDADMIGNLCLISRRNNSSLNDKDPREKIRGDKTNLQPKRRIMYKITEYENDWNTKQILEHQKDIEQLIEGRTRVLRLKENI